MEERLKGGGGGGNYKRSFSEMGRGFDLVLILFFF